MTMMESSATKKRVWIVVMELPVLNQTRNPPSPHPYPAATQTTLHPRHQYLPPNGADFAGDCGWAVSLAY